MKRAGLFAVLVISSAMALGALPIFLNTGEMDVTEGADFYFDADPSLGIAEASSPAFDERFTAVAGRQVWVGKKAPVAWLRFALDPGKADTRQDLYLEVRPSFSIILDHVDLYLPRDDGGFDHLRAGALEARRPGDIPSRYFLFPLPHETLGRRCYLRASSSMDVEFHLSAWTGLALARKESLEKGAYGLIFGILLAMILYNSFLFTSLHDGAYLFYVLYVAFASAWVFILQGFSRDLFGSCPGTDQPLLWLFAGLMIATGGGFASAFLHIRGNQPFLFALLIGVGVLAAIGGAMGFFGLYHPAFFITNWSGAAICVLIVVSAVWRIIQAYKPARYFLLAWGILGAGGSIFVLMDLKVLPVNFWTKNGLALGLAAESILLSLSLADRFKRIECEKLLLERDQARLRRLSLTDELTGLYNKRYLLAELKNAANDAHFSGEPLAAILLDLDNFKAINDSYGHGFGDRMLISLAASIRDCIRENDAPCRFGGEEFVIIMPNTDKASALRVAERIREHFAAERHGASDEEAIRATISLGVAELAPGEDANSFLDRTDGAMYEAKRLGKNRSFAV